MLCLAMQSKLEDTFTLAGNAPRFHKRTFESITADAERYVKEFSSLPTNEQTKERRTAVTQQLTHSIVYSALGDIPLDCVSPASMHVILGLTKKIVEWIETLFAKLEALEEEKTKGATTFQFRQAVTEARDSVVAYEEWLLHKFKGVVDSVEGKKKEPCKLVISIGATGDNISQLPPGQLQES